MQEAAERLLGDDYSHLEDIAMKTAAQYFGEELLEWIGEKEKPVRVVPTELIHLEARKMYEDFNYEMADGCWYHFEFESDRITLEDLKRFREYEATTSRIFGVPVVTCVICSANVLKIQNEFTEGLNCYRVKIIRMKDSDADDVFQQIQKKKTLNRKDLIPILLSPLMSGKMNIKERILQGIRLVQKETIQLEENEADKMQAILYAFANKFLNGNELKEIEEAIVMTTLGQMLMEDGYKQGRECGIEALTETCRELGLSQKDTLAKIISKFHLDETLAKEYLLKFWK